MPAADMPAAEVDVGVGLVRHLLADQCPDVAGLPLTLLANGWDNIIYRLGDELSVRLPRRAMAAPLVEHEQRWLPRLAPALPLPVPVPVHAGRPGRGYPWAWSVCRWVPGDAAAQAPFDAQDAAVALGTFLLALHRPAPADAPENPFRGVALRQRDDRTRAFVAQLHDVVDRSTLGAASTAWVARVQVDPWPGPPVWLHGDLHPLNILVRQRRVSGVVDFGDLTAGDPATDLSMAWMLLPADVHGTFRAAAGDPDDDTWARAAGWALTLALAYLANSADNPVLGAIGRRTLEAVLTSA